MVIKAKLFIVVILEISKKIRYSEYLLFFCSWFEKARILQVMHNDENSLWLVAEEEEEVKIGFVVSFTPPITQSLSRFNLS